MLICARDAESPSSRGTNRELLQGSYAQFLGPPGKKKEENSFTKFLPTQHVCTFSKHKKSRHTTSPRPTPDCRSLCKADNENQIAARPPTAGRDTKPTRFIPCPARLFPYDESQGVKIRRGRSFHPMFRDLPAFRFCHPWSSPTVWRGACMKLGACRLHQSWK